MSTNYFEDLCKEVLQNDRICNFESGRPSGTELTIKSKNAIYQICNDISSKKVILSKITENSPEVISTWLFDEENISKKDITLIAQDFAESIVKSPTKRPKAIKKKSSNDESNVTGLFFANRMVNIFPEIKKDICTEKECYEEFRAVKFAKEILLPKINNLLGDKNADVSKIKKLAKSLSELYSSGSLDVRSIITIVILNHVENPETLKSFISDELKTAWQCALKYKDKKVKPEKPKKKSSFISKALEYQQQEETQKRK